jgi:hypothetical protein
VFCEDTTTGNISESIHVMFKGIYNNCVNEIKDFFALLSFLIISVLEPPLIDSVQFRYSYLTGDPIGFLVEFNDLVNT